MFDGRSIIIGIGIGLGMAVVINATIAASQDKILEDIHKSVTNNIQWTTEPINQAHFVMAVAAISPSGKMLQIKADEDGRVICAPRSPRR